MFAVVIVITSLFTLTNFTMGFRLIKDRSNAQLQQSVASYADKINSELIKKESLVGGVSAYITSTFDRDKALTDPGYIENYAKNLHPYFSQLATLYQDIWVYFNYEINNEVVGVWYFDEKNNGQVEFMEELPLDSFVNGQERQDKAWYFEPRNTRLAQWLNPYPSELLVDQNVWWLTYSNPIILDGQFIAVVGTDFNFNSLKTEIEGLDFFENGYAVLLSQDLDYLIHPTLDHTTNVATQNDGQFLWIAEMMRAESHGMAKYTWLDQQAKIMAYQRLVNGMVFTATAYESDLYSDLYLMVINTHGILLLSLAITYLVIKWTSKHLTAHLEGLTQAVFALNPQAETSVLPHSFLSDTTEVGLLAMAISDLHTRLSNAYQVIADHNSTLQAKISNKTQALEDTNKALENVIDDMSTLQEQLIQAEKNEAISQILIELAHRMNTPIGNAITYVSFAKRLAIEHVQDQEANELLETLDHIEKNISLSADIIGHLKSINQDLKATEREKINVCTWFKEVNSYLKTMYAHHKDHTLHVECDSTLTMTTYPELVLSVIQNFVQCSLSSSQTKVAHIFIKVEATPNSILMTYSDSLGLRLIKNREVAFIPFSYSTFAKGVHGLELYFAKSLVQNGLNGDIYYTHDLETNTPQIVISLPYEHG